MRRAQDEDEDAINQELPSSDSNVAVGAAGPSHRQQQHLAVNRVETNAHAQAHGNLQVPPDSVVSITSSLSASRLNNPGASNMRVTRSVTNEPIHSSASAATTYSNRRSFMANENYNSGGTSNQSIVIPVGGPSSINQKLDHNSRLNRSSSHLRQMSPRIHQHLHNRNSASRSIQTISNHSSININSFGPITVRERNAQVLYSESMSDVMFLVGEDKVRIPAHTFLLANGSSVFYAMFYGKFEKQAEIEIQDVDPTAFKIMLAYLYTDEISLSSETVLDTLYAAKKYMVQYLVQSCIDHLQFHLTAHNVCLMLTQSQLFEESELIRRCWDIVDAQASLAVQSSGFLEIDLSTLRSIICRETLNVNELVLFKAVIEWAKAECHRQELDSSLTSNVRGVLGDAFYLVRLPAMQIVDFADNVAKSGYLDAEETTSVFLYLTAADKPQMQFISHPRRGLTLNHCRRFQSSAYRSNQWRYRGRCDSIQFSCDQRIFVSGFGLYGSSNGQSEYKATIELKEQGLTLAVATRLFKCDGTSDVFQVLFDQPVQVYADTFYTASAVLDGVELSYFGQEGLPETQCAGATFKFQSSSESTNGTGIQGGQIPEILFYGIDY